MVALGWCRHNVYALHILTVYGVGTDYIYCDLVDLRGTVVDKRFVQYQLFSGFVGCGTVWGIYCPQNCIGIAKDCKFLRRGRELPLFFVNRFLIKEMLTFAKFVL